MIFLTRNQSRNGKDQKFVTHINLEHTKNSFLLVLKMAFEDFNPRKLTEMTQFFCVISAQIWDHFLNIWTVLTQRLKLVET